MKGFRICRIFGIDIELHWTWIFVFALFTWEIVRGFFPQAVPGQPAVLYWLFGILTVLVFFLSLLFHEVSHSLAARKFNISVKRITLFIFGGAAQMVEKRPKTAKAEFWMALAGPMSSLVAAGFFLGIAAVLGGVLPKLVIGSLEWLGIINIVLAAFNILPIFPMDGGRVLRSLWWWKAGNLLQATGAAVKVAVAMAVIFPVGFFFLGGLFPAFFVGFVLWSFIIPGAFAEYHAIKNGLI